MKILIIKSSALGDIIHVFPVVDYLKDKFPLAQIDWVVEAPFADLVEAHPSIHRVIKVHTKEWRKGLFKRSTWSNIKKTMASLRESTYDVVLDLQGNTKSALWTGCSKAKVKVGLGRHSVSEWPNLLATTHRYEVSKGQNIRTDYLTVVARHYAEQAEVLSHPISLKLTEEQRQQLQAIITTPYWQGATKRIMVCPGSAWPNKTLSNDALQEVLQIVQQRTGCSFFFTWGSQLEKNVSDSLQELFSGVVLDRLPFPVLQNLMAQVDLVFAMDSLPLHLAGTTATPTFSVFGPSLANKYNPPNGHALQGACPYGRTFEKRCPILRTCPTGACIRELTPQQVAHSLLESL